MEADVPARSKDHASSVDITIMRSTTLGTIPTSYSETFRPSRAADASAFGTGLGTPSFVGFNIHRLPSGSLVSQHMPECAPARVQDGLGHPGTSELSSIHIADDDQTVFLRQLGAGNVKMMTPRIGDLGMDRADAALVSCALSLGKRDFVSTIMLQRRDFGPVAARGERLETEVNTHLAVAGEKIVFDFTLKGDVPAPACILNKGSGLERAFDLPRLPEPKAALEVGHSVAIDAHGTRDEWNPAERSFGSEAGAKARTLALGIPRRGKLSADRLNGIGMQPEQRAASGTQFDQVIGGRPAGVPSALAAAFSLALRRGAEIPDPIAGLGVIIKVLSGRRILDPIFEGKYHANILLFAVRSLNRLNSIINKRREFILGMNAEVSFANV